MPGNRLMPHVFGKTVDDQTRCEHYRGPLDIIAIKFKCCGMYYPCHLCHEEEAGHPIVTWPKVEWNEKAILCGFCKAELTINEYRSGGNQCPNCGARFNPNCSLHYDKYFG